jgi:gliding motility-associated protein GldM
MTAANQTTRQKMINMMYLVLTALLALNVSAEILKAFHLVETKMDRTGNNLSVKNEGAVGKIAKYNQDLPNDEMGKQALQKALLLQSISKEGVIYFQSLKEELINKAGGRNPSAQFPLGDPTSELLNPDNTEIHAYLLLTEGRGTEVKNKINELRERMLAVLSDANQKALVRSELYIEEPKVAGFTWESQMFENVPLAAVVAMISNIQNDIRNTESQVLDVLAASLTKDLEVVDNFIPAIIPETGSNITLGSPYKAKIFLAASSSRAQPEIKVNGQALKINDGYGIYNVVPNKEGEHKFVAEISTTNANGKKSSYSTKGSFFTTAPMAVISATKMNVVYVGLDNPISVSVPGVPAKDVNVSCSMPQALGKMDNNGTYNLKPTIENGVNVLTIKAEVNGRVMGTTQYRIRNVPKPTLQLSSIENSGSVSVARVRSIKNVNTVLKDFIFDGIRYAPQTWVLAYQQKNSTQSQIENGRGTEISISMKNAFSNAKPGDKIILTNVTALGPSGPVRVSNSLIIDVVQ